VRAADAVITSAPVEPRAARRRAPPTPTARSRPSTVGGPNGADVHVRHQCARRPTRCPTVRAADAVITGAPVEPRATRRRGPPTPIARASPPTVRGPNAADDHIRHQCARRATRCSTVRAVGVVITSAPVEPQSARRRAPPTPIARVCPYTGAGSDGANNRRRRRQLARRAAWGPTVRVVDVVITCAPVEPQAARRNTPATPSS